MKTTHLATAAFAIVLGGTAPVFADSADKISDDGIPHYSSNQITAVAGQWDKSPYEKGAPGGIPQYSATRASPVVNAFDRAPYEEGAPGGIGQFRATIAPAPTVHGSLSQ